MFKAATGLKYTEFLAQLHAEKVVDWYLEIGCRRGGSLFGARSKSIAVDPFFQIKRNVVGPKPVMMLFQETSDAFFDRKFLETNNIKLSFAFLDGMHLFEYLLRDFIAAEANAAPGGVIAMHDCCPFSHEMTTRDLDNLPRGAWTGDVWKVIPIIKEYRPDIEITVLDCAPTGLVMASNLKPGDQTLAENYGKIVARFEPVQLQDFGVEAFNNLFDYTSGADVQAGGFSFLDEVVLKDDGDQRVKVTP